MKNLYPIIIYILILSVLVPGKGQAQRISTGAYHSMIICYDKTGMSWGMNGSGELGNGNLIASNIPTAISNLQNLNSFSGGYNHSLALKNDGTVWSWGRNTYGQLGNGNNSDTITAIHVASLNNIVKITAGNIHSMALRSDSTIWAWGNNGSGQLGTGNFSNSSLPVQISNLTGMVDISGGDDFTLALKSDSTVWAWGSNDQGQLGTGSNLPFLNENPLQVSNLTEVIAIAASGYKFSLALKADGTVWAWGYNIYGQLGDGTMISSNLPVQVNGLTNVIAIAKDKGFGHALALKSDGTVWAWGYNQRGELGNGSNINSSVPVQVNNLSGVIAIARGHEHCIALKSDGSLWAWGGNGFGQLGDGTTTSSNIPVLVSGLCPLTSGLNELPKTSSVSLYPNPSSTGNFIVELRDLLGSAVFEVYDLHGKRIYTTELQLGSSGIDLSKYGSGIYFYRIQTSETKITTGKIMIR